jgi:hypothetical protein
VTNSKKHLRSGSALGIFLLMALVSFAVPQILLGEQNLPSLQIDLPTAGSIMNPGQTITVSVSSPAGTLFSQVAVIAEAPIPTLLSPGEEGHCAENALAVNANDFVLNTAVLHGSYVLPGAVADLAPNSAALSQIANRGSRPLPTALIAGTQPNFDTTPPLIALVCTMTGDFLAGADESLANWNAAVFGNQPNDGLVPETSELDGLPPASGFIFPGVDHTDAIEGFLSLGFAGPGALDEDSNTGIPFSVIRLLNTSIANPAYVLLNP